MFERLRRARAGNGSGRHLAEAALDEVSKAAASLKGLADFLKRHPESLLKGKPDDPK